MDLTDIKLSSEQGHFLSNFKKEAKKQEALQLEDLLTNCTNKFQFAKTYKTYDEDWENTKKTMLSKAGQEGTPSNRVLLEMLSFGEQLMQEKKKKLEQHFQMTWNEPIFNYAGQPSPVSSSKDLQEEILRHSTQNFEKSLPKSENVWPMVFIVGVVVLILMALF